MDELVRDKHLLTAEHTLEHWPEELYLPGPMVDRTNWDQWQTQGSRDWRARAQETIAEKLGAYEEEPLPASTHAAIRRLFETTCSDPDVKLPDFPRPHA
jgi:trimethylamine:corrinoid methyltransferase-like protein